MKVLIANSMVPFLWGGAEELAANLYKNLVIAGHQAEMMRIPFKWEPYTRIPSQMMMIRAFAMDACVDKVIALKFPTYLIPHHNKTLWVLHQYRQAYDLYDAGDPNIPRTPLGDELRNMIRNADNQAFAESRNVFTISQTITDRMTKYNGHDSKVLIPPLNDPELFTPGETGDYIFAGGRINAIKRQHLLVEAMRYAPRNAKLIVAGPPDTPGDADRLHQLVETHDLQDRVKLDMRMLPRSEYADYVRGSLAIASVPYDEDSFSYVAVEGAEACKAVITLSDSGGVVRLVDNGVSGWIARPDVYAIADAVAEAFKSVPATKAAGRAVNDYWLGLEINWPNTIETLMAA